MTVQIENGLLGIAYDPKGDIECGHCGMTWSEDITPSGRCPWEYDHEYDEDEED